MAIQNAELQFKKVFLKNSRRKQGCQMGSFQTKNPNLGKFWRDALDWKMLIYFRAIWNVLQTFGIFYDHLVSFVFIWNILRHWGYFMTIGYLLCSFGTFLRFWYQAPRKIWQPWSEIECT
jgi:hypothetical protein